MPAPITIVCALCELTPGSSTGRQQSASFWPLSTAETAYLTPNQISECAGWEGYGQSVGRGESSSATILFGKPGPRRRRDNDAELINERRADRGFRVLYFMPSCSGYAETAMSDAVAAER